MLWIILGSIISYLIGSIPTAYIFGRILKGIDIRNFGSGNIGATNALRVLGRKVGVVVLLIDILKGFLCIIVIGNILLSKTTLVTEQALLIIMGACCICGHNWTVFLKFKGGKGIAASLGVLLGLSLKIAGLNLILLSLLGTWLLLFIISRTVSLASILTAISLPIYTFLFKQSHTLILFSILLSVLVIIRHRSNIVRIFQGKESRLKL